MWKKRGAINCVTDKKDLFFCPFCGCHGFGVSEHPVQVICDNCGARGPIKDESQRDQMNYNEMDAYTCWNKRDYDCLCANCDKEANDCNTCVINEQ
jgi:hypothetical protein